MTQTQKKFVINEINEKVITFKRNEPQFGYESERKRNLLAKLLKTNKIKLLSNNDLKGKVINELSRNHNTIDFENLLVGTSVLIYQNEWSKSEAELREKRNQFMKIFEELVQKSKTLIRSIMLDSSEEALKAINDFDKVIESYSKKLTTL